MADSGSDHVESGEGESTGLSAEDVATAEAELLQTPAIGTKQSHSRRDADALLVEWLAATGFHGDRFEAAYAELAGSLMAYAWPIMLKWIRGGAIVRLCAKIGRPVTLPEPAGLPLDDRQELATETVLAGAMHSAEDRPDPLSLILLREEVAEHIDRVHDKRLRSALGYRAVGYSVAEAAELVGLTQKALENRLRRHRRKFGIEAKSSRRNAGPTPDARHIEEAD